MPRGNKKNKTMKKTNTAICLLVSLACCLLIASRADAITRTSMESADHNTFQYTIDWSDTGNSSHSDKDQLFFALDIRLQSVNWRLIGSGYDSDGMTRSFLYYQDYPDQTFIPVSVAAFDFSWDDRNFLGVDSIYLLSGNASIVQGESWVTITAHNPLHVPDGGSSLLMLFSAVAVLSGIKLRWAI